MTRSVVEVPLAYVLPNPDQPRRRFAVEPLNELAASIRQHGVKSPLLVRERLATVFCEDHPGKRTACQGHERYVFDIVAGERRYRAAKIAGLETVPVLVEDLSDADAEEIAILENVARQDLNPMEEARAYAALTSRGMEEEDIARRVGCNPSTVRRRIRLLNLAVVVQELVEKGQLQVSVAEQVARLDGEAQHKALQEAIRNGYDSNQARAYVDRVIEHESQSSMFSDAEAPERDAAARDARARLETAIDKAVAAIGAALDPKTLTVLPAAVSGDEDLIEQRLAMLELSVKRLRRGVRVAMAQGRVDRLL